MLGGFEVPRQGSIHRAGNDSGQGVISKHPTFGLAAGLGELGLNAAA
ncbi:MAG: hypothetical protein NVSMB2_14540 [Chloroflexota bacterium]